MRRLVGISSCVGLALGFLLLVTSVGLVRPTPGLTQGAEAAPFSNFPIRRGAIVASAQTNLLKNGSFEKDGRIPLRWRGKNLTSKDRRICWTAHHGSCSFRMVGTNAYKSLRQIVRTSGSAGDSFTLSGWSKARDPSRTGGAYCLQAKIFYTDGTKENYRTCFAKRTHRWQYKERHFAAAKDYNKVVVSLLYFKQSGKAWFDDVRLIPTEPLPVGVQMLGEENSNKAVSRAEEAGANWVRISLNWSSIEAKRGKYNWNASFDAALSRLAAHGMTPIVEVRSSPKWAHRDTGQGCGPIDPEDLDDFRNFVAALVERYDGDGIDDAPGSPKVKYWEFWNEPDNKSLSSSCAFVGGCWGGDLDNDGTPDPVEYVRMLRQAYAAVKASDPEGQVVFGGIALEQISEGCFNLKFLDQVLKKGGGAYFDLMNFHQYDFKRDEWDGTLPYKQGIIGKATYIKNKLASYGLSKPLICSEIGLSSNRTKGQDELQARHLVHEFVRGMSMWPDDIKAIIWFTLVDYPDTVYYGLIDDDGSYTPHLAHHAYQVMTSQLEGAEFERQLGKSETGHAWIQAYRFDTGSRKILVLWTDSGEKIKAQPDRKIDMAIGQAQLNDTWTGKLRIVDLYGNVRKVRDGGAGDRDGKVNGSITLQISQSPIYVSVATP